MGREGLCTRKPPPVAREAAIKWAGLREEMTMRMLLSIVNTFKWPSWSAAAWLLYLLFADTREEPR
jgi:hypothetical protein